ncbi:MAG TPA: tetratricopeptide repeat protein [Bacteroidia bacterium]|jgi:serine phosphatase RsbU (regulator of sigma subunit)|nr:tetratricopeptide repeat protein [Bacteroidia bacterium]
MNSNKRILTAITFLIASLLIFQPLNSQNKKIDSLRFIFPSVLDTSKVQILCQFARFYTPNNPDTGEVLSNKALQLAKKINYPYGIAYAYSSLGSALTTKSKYDEAIQTLLLSLNIYEKINHKNGIAHVCNTIANTYIGLGNNAKAYEYYLKCFNISDQKPVNEHMLTVASFGLGSVLVTQNKSKEAITYFEKAVNGFNKEGNAPYAAMAMTMIGESYVNDSDFVSAEKYFLEAMPALEKENDEYAIAVNCNNLGGIELHKKNYAKAFSYFDKALKLNLKRGAWDNIQNNALKLSQLMERQNKSIEALNYYKMYVQYKDSVINIERNKALANAESKYSAEKKEQLLTLKNLELEKSRSEVKQRNTLIYVFIGAFLLFAVLLFLVYNQYRQKRKINILLEHQFSEIKIKSVQIEQQKNLIEEKNKDIMDSINYSKHIQQAILPSEKLIESTLPDSYFIYKPKDIISGDFYFIEKTNERIYFAVVDCTGHGVPGALLSVFAQNTLKKIISTKKGMPNEILSEICQEFKTNLSGNNNSAYSINDGMDIALACIDKYENKLYFSGAKNPLLLIRNDNMMELKADRWGISGRNEDTQLKFTHHEVGLERGDKIYMFSDGINDQFGGPKGKKFKYKQLQQLIIQASKMVLAEQKKFIENTFNNWKGNLEQLDDVTLICVSL